MTGFNAIQQSKTANIRGWHNPENNSIRVQSEDGKSIFNIGLKDNYTGFSIDGNDITLTKEDGTTSSIKIDNTEGKHLVGSTDYTENKNKYNDPSLNPLKEANAQSDSFYSLNEEGEKTTFSNGIMNTPENIAYKLEPSKAENATKEELENTIKTYGKNLQSAKMGEDEFGLGMNPKSGTGHLIDVSGENKQVYNVRPDVVLPEKEKLKNPGIDFDPTQVKTESSMNEKAEALLNKLEGTKPEEAKDATQEFSFEKLAEQALKLITPEEQPKEHKGSILEGLEKMNQESYQRMKEKYGQSENKDEPSAKPLQQLKSFISSIRSKFPNESAIDFTDNSDKKNIALTGGENNSVIKNGKKADNISIHDFFGSNFIENTGNAENNIDIMNRSDKQGIIFNDGDAKNIKLFGNGQIINTGKAENTLISGGDADDQIIYKANAEEALLSGGKGNDIVTVDLSSNEKNTNTYVNDGTVEALDLLGYDNAAVNIEKQKLSGKEGESFQQVITVENQKGKTHQLYAGSDTVVTFNGETLTAAEAAEKEKELKWKLED